MLFQNLDFNHDGQVDFPELESYFLNNQLSDGLKPESVKVLFDFLDTNKDGNISVDEFCMLIKGANFSMEERMRTAFSSDLEEEIKKEIS